MRLMYPDGQKRYDRRCDSPTKQKSRILEALAIQTEVRYRGKANQTSMYILEEDQLPEMSECGNVEKSL